MTITKTEKYMISNVDGGYYIEVELHEGSVTIGQAVIPNELLAEVVEVLQKQLKNDWIEWDGGECPVGPEYQVEVKFADGDTSEALPADNWSWKHEPDHPGNIVAYRVIS